MLASKTHRPPLWMRIRYSIRKRLLSGLLVVVPAGITFFVLRFLYNFTAGRLTPVVKEFMPNYPDYVVMPASIFILLALVYLVGLLASVFIGRKLIGIAEKLIQQIPLVKTVYNASKQMVEAISFQNQGTDFKTAVLIEFPSPGMRTLGFVMGKAQLPDGNLYYKVFLPTAPNITVGLMELVQSNRISRCSLSVEEAIKTIVSAGILAPPRIKTFPIGEKLELGSEDSDEDDF